MIWDRVLGILGPTVDKRLGAKAQDEIGALMKCLKGRSQLFAKDYLNYFLDLELKLNR